MRVRTLLGIVASTAAVALGGTAPALATTVDIPASKACVIYSSYSGRACDAVATGDYFGATQGLIQFDLSSIPAGADINSATMSLAINYDPDGDAGFTGLQEVSEPWDTTHVSWFTGDGTNVWDGAPYRAHGMIEPDSVGSLWVDWDVLGFVNNVYYSGAPNYGLSLNNNAASHFVVFFYPSSSHPPKLTVDYTL